jgi:hypothetical protein
LPGAETAVATPEALEVILDLKSKNHGLSERLEPRIVETTMNRSLRVLPRSIPGDVLKSGSRSVQMT